MDCVLHVLDEHTGPIQWQALEMLSARANGFRHEMVAVEGAAQRAGSAFLKIDVALAPRRLPRILNWAPKLAATARRPGTVICHAWGLAAAQACRARGAIRPVVVSVLDPAEAERTARWMRSGPESVTIVAGSQLIRSRLLAHGAPPETVVVVRSGVDFSEINAARKKGLREKVAGEATSVLLMAAPASRAGGEFFGLWATAIVAQIHRGLRVLMPYESCEAERLGRFLRQIRMEHLLIRAGETMRWAEMMACADALVVPAVDEVCIEPVGWAMAAGIVVVGSAVRSVTELIADKHNGLLCKPREPRALASRVLTALEDHDLRRRVSEVARGQAYEVFGMRSFVDHIERVYSNVLAGRAVGEGVTDNAVVA